MIQIQYGNRKIDFQIKRSNRRKTVGIKIDPRAGVVIYSPQSLGMDKIKDVVRKRAQWIIDKQEVIKKHSQLVSVKDFVSGEAFPYLGRQYRLKVIKSASEKQERCKLKNGRFMVEINRRLNGKKTKENVRKALIGWYVEHAVDKIPERVRIYARRIGESPQKIEIKNHKRRWGSCSHYGVVRFNWKIIMAPVTVLDYVIVHELCHLICPDHSVRFWQKVQTIIPDYTNRREKLREYSLQAGSFD